MKDIYEELGVRTFINAAGTYTIAGGSKMSEETLETMKSAASHFVMIPSLTVRQKENCYKPLIYRLYSTLCLHFDI